MIWQFTCVAWEAGFIEQMGEKMINDMPSSPLCLIDSAIVWSASVFRCLKCEFSFWKKGLQSCVSAINGARCFWKLFRVVLNSGDLGLIGVLEGGWDWLFSVYNKYTFFFWRTSNGPLFPIFNFSPPPPTPNKHYSSCDTRDSISRPIH